MHFELIFYKVWGMGGGLTVFPAPRVEETSLYFWITFVSLSKINWPYALMALFLDLVFCSIDLCVFFPPQYLTDWIAVALQEVLKSGCVQSPAFSSQSLSALNLLFGDNFRLRELQEQHRKCPQTLHPGSPTLTSYITTVQRPILRQSLWYTRLSIKVLSSVPGST